MSLGYVRLPLLDQLSILPTVTQNFLVFYDITVQTQTLAAATVHGIHNTIHFENVRSDQI